MNTCTDTEELGRQSAERFDPSVLVWILHVDGLANQKGYGAGLLLITLDGVKIE